MVMPLCVKGNDMKLNYSNAMLDDVFRYSEIEWIMRCIDYTIKHAELSLDEKQFLEKLSDEIATQYDVIRNGT